jgi:hypothetical protein
MELAADQAEGSSLWPSYSNATGLAVAAAACKAESRVMVVENSSDFKSLNP